MPDEPTTAPTTTQPDVLAGLQRLIERQGGEAGRVAELLYRENHDLRERNRTLSGQVPGQGALVLDATQVQQWTAYQQLGEPAALTQRLTAAQQASAELAGMRRAEHLRVVADAAGYQPRVLARLADGLTLELRDVAADGQTRRVPFVVTEAGATPLAEYAQRAWVDFLPALAVSQGDGTSQGCDLRAPGHQAHMATQEGA